MRTIIGRNDHFPLTADNQSCFTVNYDMALIHHTGLEPDPDLQSGLLSVYFFHVWAPCCILNKMDEGADQ